MAGNTELHSCPTPGCCNCPKTKRQTQNSLHLLVMKGLPGWLDANGTGSTALKDG